MTEPKWAQQARAMGLVVEEVSNGFFTVTNPESQPARKVADAPREIHVRQGDQEAVPQAPPEDAKVEQEA